VVAAFALLLLAFIIRSSALARCARYAMLAGLLFLIPTILAGVMDWKHYFSGGWIHPVRLKMGLAALLVILMLMAVFQGRKSEGPLGMQLVLYGFCLVTVVILGFLGAELVFKGRTPPAEPQFAAGQELFQANCSGCHPYGYNIVNPKHLLWDNLRFTKFEYLRDWLRKPESPMPVFLPDHISESEARDLFDYCNAVFYNKSLAGGEEEEKNHHEEK
jgi:mono/diheme cytochrome c family protein